MVRSERGRVRRGEFVVWGLEMISGLMREVG